MVEALKPGVVTRLELGQGIHGLEITGPLFVSADSNRKVA